MRLFRFASDEVLVDRIRAGSAPAFEALFDRHHRPLLAFCRHMLGSAADAEDAVQHTFMAAYADLMRSDKPIALRPWLYSIARHRCVSVLRARRERPVGELPEPEVDHLAAEFDSREELCAALADIAHLPDDQRAALVLAELGDASHAEIAQILGCRQEKVKALVFQARSALVTGRTARETPCAEIREHLAVGGVAVRRTWLRRHVRDCEGCREFGEQLRLQRRRLRILLPVAPGLGFKSAVLGAVSASGGGGVVTAAVGAAGVSGLAATAIVSVAIAGGGGSPAAVEAAGDRPRPAITASVRVDHAPRRAAPARARRLSKPRRTEPAATAPRRERKPADRPAGAEPDTTVAVLAAPAPSSPAPAPAPSSAAPPAQTRAQPARRPAAPPGHERRATPPGPPDTPRPHPPGGGKPAEPPGGGKPAEPPAKGPPPGVPGGGPDQHQHPGANPPGQAP